MLQNDGPQLTHLIVVLPVIQLFINGISHLLNICPSNDFVIAID